MNKQDKNPRDGKKTIIKIIIVLVLFTLIYVGYLLVSSYPKDKITILSHSADNELFVVHFDPVDWSVTSIKLPPDLEINVADNKGKWKVKSLWQLSVQESKVGELARESIVRSLHLPLTQWDGQDLQSSLKQNIVSLLFKKIDISKTTLTKKDLLSFAWYQIMRAPINSLDYAELSNENIKKIFSETQMGEVEIYNQGSRYSDEAMVASLINVLGGKVVLTKTQEKNADIKNCVVISKNKYQADKLKKILGCDSSQVGDKTKIYLGSGIL